MKRVRVVAPALGALVLAPLLAVTPSSVASSGHPIHCVQPVHNRHLYYPERLTFVRCAQVSGTVARIISARDGDYHVELQLDPGQESLINAANVAHTRGHLVVEEPCQNVSTLSAIAVCVGYVSPLPLMVMGRHYTVTGAYVQDGIHGWMEIHGVALECEGAAIPRGNRCAVPR